MSNLKVYSATSIAKMKANPHYDKAKKGDFEEAMLLVDDLVIPDKFPLKNDEILVPVLAQEQGGRNKIPLALATYLSHECGNEVELNILQSVRANHTGNDAAHRLKNVLFTYQNYTPFNGKKYVIVDDHVTMGGTVAGLAKFIRDCGGEVEKVFSISNNTRQIKADDGSFDIAPSIQEVDECRRRFDDWVEEYAEMKYEDMPRPTIQYLLKFKSKENLQNRCKNITASANVLTNDELTELWNEFSGDFLRSLFNSK